MMLAVVGDSLLDIDLVGTASRLCPDAPAPVLDLETERVRAGGAGLAARLAAADGVDVTLISAVAEGPDGDRLRAELSGLPTVFGPAEQTPVKTRLLAAGRPIARVDRGCDGGPPTVTGAMVDAIRAADAVLVSDYGQGLTADERLRDVLTERAAEVPVVWDPHPRGADPVPGTAVVTPNLAEATALIMKRGSWLRTAEWAARELIERWHANAIAVTLGARGVLAYQGHNPRLVPARRITAADPCGAGDRFASKLAIRLMAGDDLLTAIRSAVEESARFLAAGGVLSVYNGQTEDSPIGLPAARRLISSVRARGGTVVATGGCFDLLHAGHARTLRAARDLGDCLVVCLNSDTSVRLLKGKGRPVNGQRERAELLSALGCVDAVVVFEEEGPERLLAELRPDIWVKGGDYTPDSLPETELVRGWGGEVVVTPYLDGHSTTRLVGALSTT